MHAKHVFAVVVILLLFSSSAHSALVTSLTFKDPTGTVSPTDTIDLWVTLSVGTASEPLVIDPGLNFPYGLPASLMAPIGMSNTGQAPFASYTGANRSGGIRCTFSSLEHCFGGAPYEIQFNRGDDSFMADPDVPFMMSTGESRDFLLFSLVPTGTVVAGNYSFFQISVSINLFGLDAEGNELRAFVPIATTCSNYSCSFTRTVPEVPLPAAGFLFAGGLGLFGALRDAAPALIRRTGGFTAATAPAPPPPV